MFFCRLSKAEKDSFILPGIQLQNVVHLWFFFPPLSFHIPIHKQDMPSLSLIENLTVSHCFYYYHSGLRFCCLSSWLLSSWKLSLTEWPENFENLRTQIRWTTWLQCLPLSSELKLKLLQCWKGGAWLPSMLYTWTYFCHLFSLLPLFQTPCTL